ncbi:MAG: virulence-associated E family protein [Bacteroidia bacterium]|nr:virulence-associated E family protein [Bacteroidia bacterium]MDW8347001.1 VapE family protein [Bacteroidia bacterium]
MALEFKETTVDNNGNRSTTPDNNPAKKGRSSVHVAKEYLEEFYDFRYNTITNTLEIKRRDESVYKEANENDLLCELLEEGIRISDKLLKVILSSSFVPQYNPFIEYFENLPKWDKNKPDYIKELASYIKAKDPARFEKHFRKMFVRIVRSVYEANYYNKHCFVLVHDKQNSGKTTFCEFLCPKSLKDYMTSEFSPNDKDSLIALTENILINLDELATLSKADLNQLKSVFSKTYIKVRKPYARKASVAYRVASFVGSTNNLEFLTDETGSVRWLCFEIEGIDWAYRHKVDMDNVYAQALYLYKNGIENGQLTAEEIAENEIINRIYQVTTIEMHALQNNYEPCDENDPNALKLTTSEVLTEFSELFKQVGHKSNIIVLGRALKYLGYRQVTIRDNGIPVKKWVLKKAEKVVF